MERPLSRTSYFDAESDYFSPFCKRFAASPSSSHTLSLADVLLSPPRPEMDTLDILRDDLSPTASSDLSNANSWSSEDLEVVIARARDRLSSEIECTDMLVEASNDAQLSIIDRREDELEQLIGETVGAFFSPAFSTALSSRVSRKSEGGEDEEMEQDPVIRFLKSKIRNVEMQLSEM